MFFQSQEDIRKELKEIEEEEFELKQKRNSLATRRQLLEKLCKRDHSKVKNCPDCGWETY